MLHPSTRWNSARIANESLERASSTKADPRTWAVAHVVVVARRVARPPDRTHIETRVDIALDDVLDIAYAIDRSRDETAARRRLMSALGGCGPRDFPRPPSYP